MLYGQKGKKYVIADPAVGMRYLSRQELISGWTNGVMLLLEPRPDFQAQSDDQNKVSSFNRFLQQFWNYRTLVAEALILNFVLGLLSLTSPFLLQILTDDVLIRGDTHLLNSVIIAALVMNLISSSLRFIQSNLVAHFAQRLELNLVLEFGRAILSLPLPYYESHRSGEIISRLRDIQAINQLISQAGIILPSQLFVALVSLGFMLG